MAFVVVFEAPGMTASQYDAVDRALEAAGQRSPAGRLYHVAAPTDDGWLVVDVWESEDQLAQFSETLRPILEKAGAPLVQPRTFPAHNVIAG